MCSFNRTGSEDSESGRRRRWRRWGTTTHRTRRGQPSGSALVRNAPTWAYGTGWCLLCLAGRPREARLALPVCHRVPDDLTLWHPDLASPASPLNYFSHLDGIGSGPGLVIRNGQHVEPACTGAVSEVC